MDPQIQQRSMTWVWSRLMILSGPRSDLDLILSNQDHIRINDRIHDLLWILYGSTDQTRIHDLDLIHINDPIRTQMQSGSDLYLILSNQDHLRINDRIHDLVWILNGSTDQTRFHDLDLIEPSDPSMIWDPLQILDQTLIGYWDPGMILWLFLDSFSNIVSITKQVWNQGWANTFRYCLGYPGCYIEYIYRLLGIFISVVDRFSLLFNQVFHFHYINTVYP
jgi:hypothetical protein